MVQPRKHRAPKQKNVQCVPQQDASQVSPEGVSLPKEDHAVKEEQSYAMVKGLLQVLVASIAYQRNLFPKTCFKMPLPSSIGTDSDEQVEHGSNITSRDNELAHLATALAQRDQAFILLTPRKSSGVDQLLEWMEEIFKSLLDHSLDRVQFSIHADQSKPSEVLEQYTFSFQYFDGKDGERRLMGLTAPGHGSGIITPQSVRSGMVNVIDQFNNYQQKFPALPKKRYLICHLFNSPYAPLRHQRLGFHTCTDTDTAIIENGSKYLKSRSLGSIDSGHHRVSLDIALITYTDAAKDFDHRPVLTQNIEYTSPISKNLKPGLKRRNNNQAAPPVDTRMIKRPREGFTQADEQGDSISLETSQDGTEDSSRLTRATRRASSQRPASKDPGENVGIHDTLSGHSAGPTQIMEARDAPAPPTWDWKLRAMKGMEMAVKRERKEWAAARDDHQVIHCECSCDAYEPPMLQCICCQKMQHYHCYGFAVETHVHEHHCYQCLFEDTHGALLEEMKRHAIFRRALWVLYENKPSSRAEFVQKLQFNGKLEELIKRLIDGNYLTSGTTQISLVTTPEQSKTRSHRYQNPLTCVGIFYEPREDTTPANTNTEDENTRCNKDMEN